MTRSHKTTLALSFIAATALAFILGPALLQSASAVRVEEKTETKTGCNDPRFAERESCPGKSEDSSGVGETGEREDETTCTARNKGQAKDCPPSDEVIIVNPQK